MVPALQAYAGAEGTDPSIVAEINEAIEKLYDALQAAQFFAADAPFKGNGSIRDYIASCEQDMLTTNAAIKESIQKIDELHATHCPDEHAALQQPSGAVDRLLSPALKGVFDKGGQSNSGLN